ncbi:GspH/FimT family pseudopilin [Hydrogenophaga sp. 5NK40-0174]|uniref:GspH/FimT family pseudopilin n=1 Tax=Hydrogenophaga sp. 5NK40-0174 TaxID=3127649 RepID=UPI00333F416B
MRTKETSCGGQTGFTLVEVMVAVCVLAILLGVAIPRFERLIEKARLKSIGADFLVDLQLARSEAIVRGRRVALCAAASSEACSPKGDWTSGWMLFVDSNNNGSREIGELVLRYHTAVPPGWRVAGNRPVSRYISYNGLGATRLTSGAFQAGTVTVCKIASNSKEAIKVVINSVGRPRMELSRYIECEAG